MKRGQPDVTLLLDNEGVIRDVKLSDENAEDRLAEMIGRRWVDTVAQVGGEKIKAMVADARAGRVSGLREVTQRLPGGRELLLEYTTVCLAASAGFVAVGRNLQTVTELQAKLIAAQQAMERDYWKLRQVESRYRILFDASTEAVLLVSAGDLRIVEANPAAMRALSTAAQQRGKTLVGRELLPEFGPEDRAPIQSALAQARELGRAPGILIHIGPDRTPWTVRASLMASEPGPLYLLQFAPMGANGGVDFDEGPAIEDLIEQMPDAFVVLSRDGTVVHANRGFLDLVQLGTRAQAVGAPLGRWLVRPGADMTVLMTTLLRHRVLRLFSTTVRGDLGMETEVEISAAVASDETPYIGMLLRDVGRRLAPPSELGNGIGAIRLPMAEQIGKSTLRQLVKQTVQVVERHYVEAALQMTGGNRSAAAEVLGLSRQNLYSKLDRYGLMGKADADQDDRETD
jgi:transcriptional regulator PpsR